MFTQDICERQLKSNYLFKKNRYSCVYFFSVSMLTLVAMITGVKSSNAQETNSLSKNNRSSLKNNQSPNRGRRSSTSLADLNVLQISQQNSPQPISADKNTDSQLLSQIQESSPINNQDLAAAQNSEGVPEQIVVKKFQVVGSTIFSQSELNQAIKSYRNRPLTLPELFQARSMITKLYTDKGYVNSGAYIPPQELNNGTVKIEVLEAAILILEKNGNLVL